MTSKSASVWAVGVLVALGVASLVVRQNLNFEAGDNDYLLTYKADFHARKPDGRNTAVTDVHVFAAIPETTRYCRTVDHEFQPPDFEEVHHRLHHAETHNNVELRASKTGPVSCVVSFRLHLDPSGDWRQGANLTTLTKDERHSYLANARGMTVKSPTSQEILNRLRDNKPSDQELVHRIFDECQKNIEPTGELGDKTGDSTLLHQKGSPLGRAQAMVILCRAAGIPARFVTGFEIKKAGNKKEEELQPRTWVEAYYDGRWQPYDLEERLEQELPFNFVPVVRDGVFPIWAANATDFFDTYTISSAPPVVRTMLSILDLRQLSPKLKEPIKVVLILPIGALFTSLVRTIIGIRTFGTFSPTLLALAFVYNDFYSGLLIFVVVLATGFISRGVLDRLKLLLVPRLSIILTMVVMLMVLGIAVINYLKKTQGDFGGQTVLLPMVILTNLVERFYMTSEEDSFLYAMQLMVRTMLMALAIYLLLSWRRLGDVLFTYPELHFFTVAILVVMGRYTGYRLTELVRFRDLIQPPKE